MKDLYSKERQAKDKQIAELSQKVLEDQELIDTMLSANSEKKSLFQAEAQCKILQEKNKAMLTEMIALRKEIEHKDYDLQKAQQKAS